MALEECIQESIVNKAKDSSVEKWDVSDVITDVDDNPPNGFECNICLDFVQDPVVTLCGHLYCWPCIYKWLHTESISADVSDEQPPQCPVCKAQVSETTLIPLYGRRNMEDASENKMSYPDRSIPPRPPPPTLGNLIPELISMKETYVSRHDSYLSLSILRHPLVLMLNELIHGRGLRSSSTNLYNFPSSSYMAENRIPSMRRHIAQTDKSLSRVSSFLLCFILLCILLF